MSGYKLTYFETRGRAEITRLIFAAGDVSYTDHRIKLSEWKELKPSTPLGQLPVLEVEGKIYPQSVPIARFAARITGLLGKNELEQLQCDVIIETVGDLIQGLVKAFVEELEETKKLTWADLAVFHVLELPLNHYPDLLSKYSKLAEHRQKISALPKIKAWLDKRPPSER